MKSDNIITGHALLKRWINTEGKVDYKSLEEDQGFNSLLSEIENADLENYNRDERFAFWLNAYNLLTVKGVIYELNKNPGWGGNLSWIAKIRFFYLRRFKVAKRKINLYNLENKILRKKYPDFRIHFAINCASNSCPVLPGLLFKADILNDYLDELTSSFINNEEHVKFDEKSNILYLNRIFKWYKKDFQLAGGIKTVIRKYWKKQVNELDNTKIEYFDYDWVLNRSS